MIRALRLDDDRDFTPLLEALQRELIDAAIYYKLHHDVWAAKRRYRLAMAQSWTFWSLTLRALSDVTLHHLCKAYDVNRDSLSLFRFLKMIQERPDLFAPAKFRARIPDNPYADSLSRDSRLPEVRQLRKDLRYVHPNTNPRVRTLVAWRDKFYAHRDPRHVLDPASIPPLAWKDVRSLMKMGVRIINRYSQLSTASVYSTRMAGHDDYEGVLKAVQLEVKMHEAEIRRQIGAATRTKSRK
jgi:AbiU2